MAMIRDQQFPRRIEHRIA